MEDECVEKKSSGWVMYVIVGVGVLVVVGVGILVYAKCIKPRRTKEDYDELND